MDPLKRSCELLLPMYPWASSHTHRLSTLIYRCVPYNKDIYSKLFYSKVGRYVSRAAPSETDQKQKTPKPKTNRRLADTKRKHEPQQQWRPKSTSPFTVRFIYYILSLKMNVRIPNTSSHHAIVLLSLAGELNVFLIEQQTRPSACRSQDGVVYQAGRWENYAVCL